MPTVIIIVYYHLIASLSSSHPLSIFLFLFLVSSSPPLSLLSLFFSLSLSLFFVLLVSIITTLHLPLFSLQDQPPPRKLEYADYLENWPSLHDNWFGFSHNFLFIDNFNHSNGSTFLFILLPFMNNWFSISSLHRPLIIIIFIFIFLVFIVL